MDTALSQTIKDAVAHCDRLATAYGPHHLATVDALRSLAHALTFTLDAERLWPDGALSLGGVLPGGITFGVVAHPVRNMCTGCSCFLREDQTVGWYSSPVDHEHTWTRPAGPDPVIWSVHS